MLSKYLKDNTAFLDGVTNWEESITIAADPLLKKGFITQSYVQQMIENVNINGSYIVIVPGIAMPHAQNDGSVIKTSISFLKLEKPVVFPGNKEVTILIVLAAEDSTGHLDLISDISSMLIDDDIMLKLNEVTTEEELMNVIQMVE